MHRHAALIPALSLASSRLRSRGTEHSARERVRRRERRTVRGRPSWWRRRPFDLREREGVSERGEARAARADVGRAGCLQLRAGWVSSLDDDHDRALNEPAVVGCPAGDSVGAGVECHQTRAAWEADAVQTCVTEHHEAAHDATDRCNLDHDEVDARSAREDEREGGRSPKSRAGRADLGARAPSPGRRRSRRFAAGRAPLRLRRGLGLALVRASSRCRCGHRCAAGSRPTRARWPRSRRQGPRGRRGLQGRHRQGGRGRHARRRRRRGD